MAVWQLSGINRPAVTNFFAMLNADERRYFRRTPIQSMIYYTNLEPEVLSYMKRFCVKTNLYDSIGVSVMRDMFDTLSTMPDDLKPAATNRVANIPQKNQLLADAIPAESYAAGRNQVPGIINLDMQGMKSGGDNWTHSFIVAAPYAWVHSVFDDIKNKE